MAKDRQEMATKLCSPYRVVEGRKFRLKDIDPADTGNLSSKERAQSLLEKGVLHLAEMQDKLYAQDQWGLLLIFQAMDAAGKDGTIKHVMSGINPQGCRVFSFKSPSAEELDHDYLWRTSHRAPERGTIGIFNRSYYEEVLVVRVHPEYLKYQKLPEKLVTKRIWEERFEDINHFERYLTRNGIAIRKFFLHVSKDEQKKRFLERIELKEKNWKFSLADAKERQRWEDYHRAYEDMIRNTATPWAPWYVVPADHKWFSRIVVASAICEALEEMDLAYPNVGPEKICELGAARASLLNEGPARKPAAKTPAKQKEPKQK
jgi:PPK2 family polyphosphate:nucleotide phosphotransferase